MATDQPTMACPRCGKEYEDFDGFGVLYCPKPDGCGYCKHASRSDGICCFCGDEADVVVAVALDLDAIKARLAAATSAVAPPWAWESVGEKDNSWCIGSTDPPHLGEIVEEYDEKTRTYSEKPEVVDFICESGGDAGFSVAALIAHAPTDLAALVAEVERLRATVEQAAAEERGKTREAIERAASAHDSLAQSHPTGADKIKAQTLRRFAEVFL